MTETVLSFFDNNWTPALWLTPAIKGIGTDGATLFTWTMTEVSDWWYKYVIEQYNKYVKYLITVDWWVVMWANRYQYVTNELDSYDNKDDRKNTGLVIDNTAIAREVWAMPTDKPRKWSYGEIVQREIVIPKVEFTPILEAIKKIPEWVKIKDIKEILPEYNDSKVLAWIKEINKYVLSVIKKQDEVLEDLEEIEELVEWHKNEMIWKMEDHKWEMMEWVATKNVEVSNLKKMITDLETYLEKYSESISDLDIAPNLLSQYSEIVKNLWDRKELDKKITYITFVMEDILSKLK